MLRERPNFVDAQAALGLARFLSGDADGAGRCGNVPDAASGEPPGGGVPVDAYPGRSVTIEWLSVGGAVALTALAAVEAGGTRNAKGMMPTARATTPWLWPVPGGGGQRS